MILTIEKQIYGGDGLTRLPADENGRSKAVFVPFVLENEQVEASLTGQKASFARAHASSILQPSPHRIEPACPYFTRCGGCHYQHSAYEHQLEIKKDILRETLRRTAKVELEEITLHASPPWNYRNRSRLQVQTKPTFAAGYFKLASHELLAAEQCPISSPLINRAIAALWQSGRSGRVPEGVREIEFFANAGDNQLLVEIGCTTSARRAAVRGWAEDWRTAIPEAVGVAAFRDSQSDRHATEKLVFVGADHLTYQTKKHSYRVSAGSFFQINRYLTDKLVEIVTQGQSGDLALDLYAGAGLFSTALACDFRHTVSVESSQTSTADLAYNVPTRGEAIQATAEQYLLRTESKGASEGGSVSRAKPDLVVVDPPRSGLGERVARSLANLGAPRVVYVSCDPATLARDLMTLLAAGYRVHQAHMVDLFPQTFHLESVIHLTR